MAETVVKADLRRLILDTASRILVREGYANLSMRRIAKAIDYSATSIYLYFENKEALLNQLIDDGMIWLFERLSAADQISYSSLVAKFEALCRAYVDFGLEHPEYYEIMFIAHPERSTRFPPELYRKARRNLYVMERTLEEGHTAGVFSVPHPRVTSSSIWAALHGTVSLLLAKRVDVSIGEKNFVDAAVQQVLAGVMVRLK